jgi:rod shape-determining protein MreD
MNYWLTIPFLTLCATIQVAWLPEFPIFGLKPDLALILVVSCGILAPVAEVVQWGLYLGILLDLSSGLPFGIQTISLTLIGVLVSMGQSTFFRGNVIATPVAMVAATLLYDVLILAILALFNGQIQWSDSLLRITLPTAVINAAVMPIIFFPMYFLQRRKQVDMGL